MVTHDARHGETQREGGSNSSDDFQLADLMTIDQVIDRYPIFHRSELLYAMRFRKLRHWVKGRQRFTTERWLQEWIRSELRGGDGDDARATASSLASERQERRGPSSYKMTPEQEEIAAKLLKESIMRKPRKPRGAAHRPHSGGEAT